MTVGTALAVGLCGVEGSIVEVEADVGRGLPGIYIGGLGDAAVGEARERVRTAAANSEMAWPRTKIVVSLSPAHMRKHGTGFDLAIVCAVLIANSDNAEAKGRLRRTVLIGELGLDGSIRPVRGVLPAVLAARDAGARWVVVPEANAQEAALVDGIAVGTAADLQQLWRWVLTGEGIATPRSGAPGQAEFAVDLSDVDGQSQARFALEVAAAGGHHLFMQGSPGTGKSMLAERLPTILPPLTRRQQLEVTAIHSVAGALDQSGTLITHPPFVNPHHGATAAALVGGGAIPRPGAISLAHHGVLFLDEVTLMRPAVTDALRTPLETGSIAHVRTHHRVVFPCRTQLVMAANPCRCGAAYASECTCTATDRARHDRALSGPLCDRIDINVMLTPAGAIVGTGEPGEPSAAVRERVVEARERAAHRWRAQGHAAELTNATVPRARMRRQAGLNPEAMALLEYKLKAGELSRRGVDKVIALAWTLADLDGAATFTFDHVTTACGLHDEKIY
nr:YifB family Mg chelatase-like AAA ATPase [Corynebacterium lactis]